MTTIQEDPVFDVLCEKISNGTATKEEIAEAFSLFNRDIDSLKDMIEKMRQSAEKEQS